MSTLLSCFTNCHGYILESSDNVKIVLTISCAIVSLAFITAITLLLYYIVKRICDGIHQCRQTRCEYRKEALGYIKGQLEKGNKSFENDCYLSRIEQYTRNCCCFSPKEKAYER